VPDFVYIMWLPVTITVMAVTWVLAIGGVGQPVSVGEEALIVSASAAQEAGSARLNH